MVHDRKKTVFVEFILHNMHVSNVILRQSLRANESLPSKWLYILPNICVQPGEKKKTLTWTIFCLDERLETISVYVYTDQYDMRIALLYFADPVYNIVTNSKYQFLNLQLTSFIAQLVEQWYRGGLEFFSEQTKHLFKIACSLPFHSFQNTYFVTLFLLVNQYNIS